MLSDDAAFIRGQILEAEILANWFQTEEELAHRHRLREGRSGKEHEEHEKATHKRTNG
jgi:hypothetical protein